MRGATWTHSSNLPWTGNGKTLAKATNTKKMQIQDTVLVHNIMFRSVFPIFPSCIWHLACAVGGMLRHNSFVTDKASLLAPMPANGEIIQPDCVLESKAFDFQPDQTQLFVISMVDVFEGSVAGICTTDHHCQGGWGVGGQKHCTMSRF